MIPEDWEVKKLGGIAELTSSKRIFESDYVSNGIPFYRGKEISLLIENKELDDEYFISEIRYEGIKREFGVPKKDDILITAVGTLGNVYVVPDEKKFYFKDGNLIWLKNIRNVNSYYLANQIRRKKNEIINNAIGSSQKALTIVVLKDTQIPLPPTKTEQTAIATTLSDADALIRSLEKLIAKKRNIKQGAMQELLSCKKRLPGFSGEWEVKKLGEVGKCIRGVSYNGERDLSPHDTDVTVRLLRSNNVQNGTIELNELQFVNLERVKLVQYLQENDIVICMANGSKQLVGKPAIFKVTDNNKYTFGAFMGCFRTVSNQAFSNFISCTFQTYQYRSFIDILLSGSSINNLKPSDIESITIAFPSKAEQTAIAQILSDMDAEIEQLEQRLDKYRMIKQGMMQELLTGKTRLI